MKSFSMKRNLLFALRAFGPISSFFLAYALLRSDVTLLIEVETTLAISIVSSTFLAGGIRQKLVRDGLFQLTRLDEFCIIFTIILLGGFDVFIGGSSIPIVFAAISRFSFVLVAAYFVFTKSKFLSIFFSSYFPTIFQLVSLLIFLNGVDFDLNLLGLIFFAFCTLVFFWGLNRLGFHGAKSDQLNDFSIKISTSMKFFQKRVDIFCLEYVLLDNFGIYLIMKRFFTVFDILSDVAQVERERYISNVYDLKEYRLTLRTYRRYLLMGCLFISAPLLYYFPSSELNFSVIFGFLVSEPLNLMIFGPLGVYSSYYNFSGLRVIVVALQSAVRLLSVFFFLIADIWWIFLLIPIIEIFLNSRLKLALFRRVS